LEQMTQLCPACGSGKIDTAEGDQAECLDCGWKGSKTSLLAVPLPANPYSMEINQDRALEMAKHISQQYMQLLPAHAAKPIGLCIIESGLCGKQDSKNLARLIRAACLGAHKATLDEAETIAKEHLKKTGGN